MNGGRQQDSQVSNVEERLGERAEIDNIPLVIVSFQRWLRQPVIIIFAVVVVLDDHYVTILRIAATASRLSALKLTHWGK